MRDVAILFLFIVFSNFSLSQCEDFTLTINHTDPTCPGYGDGSVSPTASGGAAPYTYEISDEAGDVLGGMGPGFLLAAGWYFVYVVDEVGCELRDSVELIDPIPMVIEDTTFTQPSGVGECDGSISVDEVSGDYETISYYWSPDPDGVSGLEANVLTGACPGTYTLVMNNELGCSVVIEDLVLGEGLSVPEEVWEDVRVTGANKVLQIQNNSTNSELTTKIYTLDGHLVVAEIVGLGSRSIPLGEGFYIVMLEMEDGHSLTKKIVIN